VRVRSRNGCASSPGHAHVAVRVDGRARSRRAPRRVVGRPPATATVGPDRNMDDIFLVLSRRRPHGSDELVSRQEREPTWGFESCWTRTVLPDFF
jgi:hypothetical protein